MMRFKRSLTTLSITLVALLGLTACGGSPGANTPGEPSSPDDTNTEVQTSIDRITTAAYFDSVYGHFNPFRSSGQASADGTILTMLYGQLVQLNQDGEMESDLAESLEPNDDFTVWTLKLKKDLVFSDGTPYDAEAVKWNLDFNSNPENGTYHVLGMMGTETAVVDDLTVEITPPAPNANFDKMISSGIGMIVSPTAYESDPDGFGQKPVGAGPYILESWSRDSEVVLKLNPTYYAADDVTVQEIVVKVIRDPSQQLNMLSSGEANITTGGTGAIRLQAEQQGFAVSKQSSSGMSSGYVINVRNAPFDDIRARQAVLYALDLDMMTSIVAGTETKASTSYFSEESPFFNGEVRPESNNPEKAQALFDELAAEGKPVSFKIVQLDTGDTALSESLQSQLLAYKNVEAKIEVQNVQTYAATINQTHDFGLMAFGTQFIDPEPRYYDSFVTGGNQNKFGYSNERVDELLNKARLTNDDAERKTYYDEAQEIIAKDTLWVKLEAPAQRWTHENDLNVPLGNDGVIFYHKITRG